MNSAALAPRRDHPLARWMAVRPLALICACFLAGVVAGHARPAPLWWAALALAAAALLAIFRKKAFALSLAILLGALHVSLFMAKPAVTAADDVSLSGIVDAEPLATERSVRVRLADVTIDGEKAPCRVMLYLYDLETPPACGDVLTVTADTWIPRGAGNPGGFDYAAWLWRQRVALCASAGADAIVSVEPSRSLSLARWTQAVRSRIAAVIHRAFDEESAGVVLALITGDRSEMDEETRGHYRAAGVSHLLALSGLHVSALLIGLEWLLRRFRLSRRASFFLTLPFMALYALLVGLPASVLRACLMHAVGGFARLDGRPRDGLSVISLSMMPLLIVNPLFIEDAGFVLSYCAVGGLALLGRAWPERPDSIADARPLRCGRWVLSALRVSLAAQASALPATVCLFNQVPLWFLPFNLLLAPLMALLFPLLLAAVTLSALWPAAGMLLAVPAERLVRLFGVVTAWGARMPLALVNAADWPAWLIALYAAALFAASPYVRFTRGRVRHRLALAAPVALAVLGLTLPAFAHCDSLAVTFVDVGQGDGAIVRAEGRVYLIDTGSGRAMAEYLLSQGLAPDGVFLSHGHSDHAAGLEAVADAFPPCPIYVSEKWDDEPMDEDVALAWEKALAAGWPVVRLRAGDELALSPAVSMTIWHPGALEASGQNENSLVCSVSYGESTVLFTGDLPAAQELIPLPRCTVLKVAHHGSKNSTGEALLGQASPAVAVISVGHNSFGHPAPEVLARLEGVAVYRTDERGAITVTLDEHGETRVTTWLPEAIP